MPPYKNTISAGVEKINETINGKEVASLEIARGGMEIRFDDCVLVIVGTIDAAKVITKEIELRLK